MRQSIGNAVRRIVRLGAAVALLASPLAAQTVRGRVLDAATGEGVAEAAVKAVDAEGHDQGHSRTAADGSFRIQLRVPQSVRIQAQRTGYRPTLTAELAVAAREAVEVEVRLSAAALTIEPLRVTARVSPPRRRSLELNGVYDRERDGLGRRVYREDIERQPNMNLAQILSRVTGTVRTIRGPYEYIMFSRASSIGVLQGGGGRCLPLLFIDGTRVSYGGSADINSLVAPNQVEAVELYSSAANIPVQFNGAGSACGVILIWTRHEQ
jgi:hypothetical protein